MKTYTEEVTIAFGSTVSSRAIVTSGQLVVKTKNGDSFEITDTLIGGSYEVFTKNLILKLSPASGVTFSIYGDDL